VNEQAEKIYDSAENRPKIAIGLHNELYVSWSEQLPGNWTGYVRFARSMDGGKHFSAPITVNHDLAVITHRFDALAVDGRGRVVVAWIDKRDLVVAHTQGKPYLGAAVYYSWSDDEGASFAPDRKLIDESCECCRIALARTPDGDVAAFFRSIFGDNIRDHAYGVLRTDGQVAHVERATFTQWQIAACPEHGPGLAIGTDGTRHAVWYSAKDKPTIWYGQLDAGHPPKHLQVVATLGASHADVAVRGNMVWITWNLVSPQGYALMLKRSTDGGVHFDSAHTIATVAGDAGSPQWLMWKGHPYAAWNTTDGFRLIAVDTEVH
jgi:hypothetical protein